MGAGGLVGAGRGPPSVSWLNGSTLDQRRDVELPGRDGKEEMQEKGREESVKRDIHRCRKWL